MNERRASSCEEHALELARRARETGDAFEFRRHVLGALMDLVGCDTAVFADPDSERPLCTVGVDEPGLKVIEYCEQNLSSRYASEIGPILAVLQSVGGALDGDYFSPRDRGRLSFYAEVVQPQYIDSMLILAPRWRGRPMGMLRLQRSKGVPFRRDDLSLALRLLPTIEMGLAALRVQSGSVGAALPQLSSRETEIALHVARGLTTPQIALLLGTSRLTVRNQIGRIFDKLGVASRAELAAWVAQSRARRG